MDARVAGIGGYGAQRTPEAGGGQTLAVNIVFASMGEQVSIRRAQGFHLAEGEALEADLVENDRSNSA